MLTLLTITLLTATVAAAASAAPSAAASDSTGHGGEDDEGRDCSNKGGEFGGSGIVCSPTHDTCSCSCSRCCCRCLCHQKLSKLLPLAPVSLRLALWWLMSVLLSVAVVNLGACNAAGEKEAGEAEENVEGKGEKVFVEATRCCCCVSCAWLGFTTGKREVTAAAAVVVVVAAAEASAVSPIAIAIATTVASAAAADVSSGVGVSKCTKR
mmetsp:Transcript_43229/g.85268  ORF Transcript_43229/g.85268 Transcript_43229/m.85268 type:complete len:210 (-) Transcript_43229:566-1195(-)